MRTREKLVTVRAVNRGLRVVCVASALVLGACSHGETGILLSISAENGVGITSLSVQVEASFLDAGADQEIPADGGAPKLPGTFFIQLPPIDSEVSITLSGSDSRGNPFASTKMVSVTPHETVKIAMTAGCTSGDGGSCTPAWTPQTSGYPGVLFAVWGSGPDEVYAVGDTLRHSSGNGVWTAMTVPADTGVLAAIWGSGADDIYAVGATGTILHRANGGNWMAETSAALTTQSLNGVWGSGPSDVYAVGDAATLIHFNGAAWSRITISPGMNDDMSIKWTAVLGGVAGSGENNVYAVGGGAGMNEIFHSNGSTWIGTYKYGSGALTSIWIDPVSGEGFVPQSLGGHVLHNVGSDPSAGYRWRCPAPAALERGVGLVGRGRVLRGRRRYHRSSRCLGHLVHAAERLAGGAERHLGQQRGRRVHRRCGRHDPARPVSARAHRIHSSDSGGTGRRDLRAWVVRAWSSAPPALRSAWAARARSSGRCRCSRRPRVTKVAGRSPRT